MENQLGFIMKMLGFDENEIAKIRSAINQIVQNLPKYQKLYLNTVKRFKEIEERLERIEKKLDEVLSNEEI